MTYRHEHEVTGGGTNTVAVVAIVVLVIVAILAVVAFGGLTWLRNLGGGGGRVNPTAQPTMSAPTLTVPTLPAPASYWSPARAAPALG